MKLILRGKLDEDNQDLTPCHNSVNAFFEQVNDMLKDVERRLREKDRKGDAAGIG